MVLGTIICLLIPGQLIGLFTNVSETIFNGEIALRIISAGFIVSKLFRLLLPSGASRRIRKRYSFFDYLFISSVILLLLFQQLLLSKIFRAVEYGMLFGLR